MSETNNGQHDQFERRCLQLAREFGRCEETYAELPDEFREFFAVIGYSRVCSFLVICELKRGRSEAQVAQRYALTRKQVRTIKENSRLRGRVKEV